MSGLSNPIAGRNKTGPMSRFWLISLMAFMALSMITVAFRAPVKAAVPSQPGWTLQFSDDFNGAAGSGLNTSNWRYDTGTGWGTGEIENMSSSTNNVFQDGNGNLVIKAIRDSSGNWTSGRIESQIDTLAAPAGGMLKVEARIQLPNVTGSAAQGYWPAFWMLGTPIRNGTTTWPSGGEIDIMENVNGTNTDNSHLHCGTDPGGPCNETTGIGGSTSGASPSLQSAFHTYSMVYDRSVSPEQIRYYLDGVNFYTIYSNQVDATTWNNAMHHGFFIIFDLAMGGGWPGNPTASTVSGAAMKVDYVAAWTQNGSSGGGTTGGGQSGTGNGYSYSIGASNSNSALVTFSPSSTMQYAILHYSVNGGGQQNVNMAAQSNGSWTYTIPGLSNGSTINYSFTYNNGTQADSPGYSWAFSNSSSSGSGGGGGTSTPIVSGADYVVVNPNSNDALDVYAAGTADFTNVDIYQQNGTAAQVWQINSNGDGTYTLVNPNSNKALDVYYGGTTNGTNVEIHSQNGAPAQKWEFIPNSDGTYTLMNPNSNMALDVAGAGTSNYTNVDIYQQNGTVAQKWILVKK